MSEEMTVHNVIIEQCKKISMSGVREVRAFDEETVVLDTCKGLLTVKGEGLNINGFSASTGELDMDGEIRGLVYTPESGVKGIRRLFR